MNKSFKHSWRPRWEHFILFQKADLLFSPLRKEIHWLGSLHTTFDQASDKAICLCTSVSSDSKGLRCVQTYALYKQNSKRQTCKRLAPQANNLPMKCFQNRLKLKQNRHKTISVDAFTGEQHNRTVVHYLQWISTYWFGLSLTNLTSVLPMSWVRLHNQVKEWVSVQALSVR